MVNREWAILDSSNPGCPKVLSDSRSQIVEIQVEMLVDERAVCARAARSGGCWVFRAADGRTLFFRSLHHACLLQADAEEGRRHVLVVCTRLGSVWQKSQVFP